ncbi:MAG: hypothetical protein HN576_00650 [Bacteriovoracaceae bacterium]|nr:hypothetical protein [Bacteriovoracaceae bacterium]
MTEQTKKWILLAIITIFFVAIFFFEPYPQQLIYHDFADKRPLFGVNNSFDVLSNIRNCEGRSTPNFGLN